MIDPDVLKACENKTVGEVENIIRSLESQKIETTKAKEAASKYREVLDFIAAKPIDEDQCIDEIVATKYLQLISSARKRGKSFTLTLTDVRRLMTRKNCAYTGALMTKKDGPIRSTDRTIDRLDNSIGYEAGNVFAVTHVANSIKNELFERSFGSLYSDMRTVKQLIKTLDALGFEQSTN
jgi:hypothetical protein